MKAVWSVIIVFMFIFTITGRLNAQLDSVMSTCKSLMNNHYISDGQQYMSLITGDQTAEFSVVFYGGNTYRIILCGGNEQSGLTFSLYDKYRNELFSGSDFNHTNYWDFQFESTIECYIEAGFVSHVNSSGFAVILIGLKN